MNALIKEHRDVVAGEPKANLLLGIFQSLKNFIANCFLFPFLWVRKSLLVLIWLTAIGCVLVLASSYDGKSMQFFGLAGSREQSISFQYPVEIVNVSVSEGEEIDQAADLVQVRRYELVAEQTIIEDQIAEIKTRYAESLDATRAELNRLRAEQQTNLIEIDTQIQAIETQRILNENLILDVSDKDPHIHRPKVSPFQVELDGLKEKRVHVRMALQAQIDNLERQLQAEVRPADLQITELEHKKLELQRQAADLTVQAKFSGSVGSVFYKQGEKVPPFEPILAVYSSAPNFIKGFIHEDLLNEVQLGQQVWIKSSRAAKDEAISCGVVTNLGSRIIEYPQRLKKNPMIAAWGREVMIHLKNPESLLLGEKVLITWNRPKTIEDQFAMVCQKIIRLYSSTEIPETLSEWNRKLSKNWLGFYQNFNSKSWFGKE